MLASINVFVQLLRIETFQISILLPVLGKLTWGDDQELLTKLENFQVQSIHNGSDTTLESGKFIDLFPVPRRIGVDLFVQQKRFKIKGSHYIYLLK